MTLVINGKTFYLRPDQTGHLGLYTRSRGPHGANWHPAKLSDIPVVLHVTQVSETQ